MSEVMTVQEAIEKVKKAECFPDVAPSREYWRKGNRYSLIAQMFYALSSEKVLSEAWDRIMEANHAHLIIMLREAGAGHDPFSNAEWPFTPAHVWENLAQVKELPTLNSADLSRVDLRWADLDGADLKGADLTGADLRWADLDGVDLKGANLTGANFSWDSLTDADLKGADLTGAIFDRTTMDESIRLEL